MSHNGDMDKYTAEHTLQLTGEYDAGALKAAFHELAGKYHPDAAEAHGLDSQVATAKMQDINEANDYLSQLLAKWGPNLTCEKAPAANDDPQKRGIPWAPPVERPTAAYNPFEGSRPGATDRSKRHTTTGAYYWSDPRYQASAANAQRRAEQAQKQESVYYNGEYESVSQKPQPEPKEDPARPFPKWYLPLWRFVAIFPYRFLFLFAVCLLVNLTDPFGVSQSIGIMSFEDALILLAIINLVKPFVTSPIRSALMWLVDRARDLSWKMKGL